jgi:hypothetical protein
MKRIAAAISRLLGKIRYTIVFDHLERSRNMAGLLLEEKRRKERERFMEDFRRPPELLMTSDFGMQMMAQYITQ